MKRIIKHLKELISFDDDLFEITLDIFIQEV